MRVPRDLSKLKMSELIRLQDSFEEADRAFTKRYEKYQREKSRFGKPVVYWGAAISIYLVSMAVGSLPVALVGGAIALWTFWSSPLCVTFRMATYNWLADILDGSQKR